MTRRQPLSEVRARWQRAGVRPAAKATIADVEAFEQREQISLPDDVRRYFLELGGMPEGVFDDAMFHFFSLSGVATMPGVEPGAGSRLYLMADLSIGIARYAAKWDLSGAGDVVMLRGASVVTVAESWSMFLEKYLVDSDDLYYTKGVSPAAQSTHR